MAEPFDCTDPRHLLDKRIASAWAALNGARASTWHSPNGDNCAIEDMCEATVNSLLETLWDRLSPIEKRDVNKRDVRAEGVAHFVV